MSENFRWVEHHDFANTSDIRRLEIENQVRLEGKIIDDSRVLRANLLLKLKACDALNNEGAGWAIFHDSAEDEGILATQGHREYLVISDHYGRPKTEHQPPRIRIITNESYMHDGTKTWLSRDFTVDEDDDAMYFVDVINPSNLGDCRLSNAILFFMTEEMELAVTENYAQYTPAVGIPAGDDKPLVPFGLSSNAEDKLYALSMGQQLFNEITPLEPAFAKQA